ncbi:MAG: LysM peptidoglycan-binding domain-containing protein [Acidobacteria bacterium]|nr:LysM peptidoglycan-binding domain-containing protein [Acidobacteriota bacterium]NIM63253.1 LysM peptidoglycan-binding domain-containing protein [Acidobacteriota bacterium]NIO60046.1 LysM peptidoglycan-binding domain-containing protein [Acidobacteriota bacterium]NIQ31117.1 LysM peptidoglycan-binding domain-containing protein [Acidobacteriota bacterium]NIQ86226.1 LysM peptidoglycan-binding domain-containing protein [Acidobacteriota bacterium]
MIELAVLCLFRLADRLSIFGLILLLFAVNPTLSRDEADGTVPLSSDLRVRISEGRDIELEVRSSEADTFQTLAERLCGGREAAPALAAWNNTDRPAVDGWTRVPLALLSKEMRRLVLTDLFPEDGFENGAWVHRSGTGRGNVYGKGMWEVALWFTGRGDLFTELMAANELDGPDLGPGQIIRIPAEFLHPAFAALDRSEDGLLVYDSDAQGPFAGYDLKAGEALYSSVVVRFTGQTKGEDVRETAELLRARNGIRDLSDIPVGFRIKIPLELLEPQFLPPKHPRRLAAEESQRELEAELAREPVRVTRGGLDGVLVIIDPGHGGRDIGTNHNGVWEHDYVYDVACRLKQMLETRTRAVVKLTLEDKQTGCRPSKTDTLKKNFQGTILTTPPFLVQSHHQTDMGVNLRWYLANSVYRRALKQNFRSDRVVFISLHADARHRSLRGVMAYVPGAAYRSRTYGFSSSKYGKFKEVREKQHVKFSKKSRVRSEAVSGRLANAVVKAFEQEKLPVQPYQPVRNRIIRGKSKFVPAVLRGNAIPTKVLIEMVNLSNKHDAKLLSTKKDRERIARAVYRSLFLHFGETPPK